MRMVVVKMKVKISALYEDSQLPKKMHKGDVGMDCHIHNFKNINIDRETINDLDDEEILIFPGQRVLCGLGFAIDIPSGYYAQIVPRSGMTLWNGFSILNTPGTIESRDRAEDGAIVVLNGVKPHKLKKGMRICQLIIRKEVEFELEAHKTLSKSERGEDGFGSTGD